MRRRNIILLIIIGGVIVIMAAKKAKNKVKNKVKKSSSSVLEALKSANNSVVSRIALAIARAEGFYVSGSVPQRNNNPGNLRLDVIGGATAVGTGAGNFMRYATAEDGMRDLQQQVRLMLTGQSAHYNPNMTIIEVARKYTTTQQVEWATNVARTLGVTIYTKLSEIVA